MAASSVFRLNPTALPFFPVTLAPARHHVPALFALPPANFLHPLPPPACRGLVPSGGCWCGGVLASTGCACACFFIAGVPAFAPTPAWPAWVLVHPTPPSPVQAPPSARRCIITEIVDVGGDDDAKAEARDQPSPRSVLPTPSPKRKRNPTSLLKRRSRAAPLPPPQTSPPPPPALRCYARRQGPRPRRLAFDPDANITSLMIRNIPNKFLKRRFMAILDQHCADENAKLPSCGGDGAAVKSEYDFLYVPVDFGTNHNKGYAFVNMTTATAARRLHGFLQGHRWWAARSPKECDVVHAEIKGLDAFVAHFSGSMFPCADEEFLPVRFEPPRDGVRQTTEHVVGRLVPVCHPAE